MNSYALDGTMEICMDQALAERIREIIPGINERAVDGDASGDYPSADMDAMADIGLLKLEVPEAYGGMEKNPAVSNDVVRELAIYNSSSAHILFVHGVGVRTLQVLADESQMRRYMHEVVEKKRRFGVAASEQGQHVMDWSCRMTPVEDGYVLSGRKHFCSGHEESDYIMVFAVLEGARSLQEGVMICMVPTKEKGVIVHGDWDAMGQRQTGSGTVTFDSVFVPREDVLGYPGQIMELEPSMWALFYQSAFCALHTGLAEGALAAAIDYARTKTRPWILSGVESAVQDPYILRTIGRMQAQVSSVRTLMNRANEAVMLVLMGKIGRAEGAIRIAEAKIVSTEVALDVTSTAFQVCGARATSRKYGIDRFYRSARTMTLHDPVDWKSSEIGNYLLTDTPPSPSFYS